MVICAALVIAAGSAWAGKPDHEEFSFLDITLCNTCHKEEGVSLNHQADWFSEHRLSAGKADANCITCHDQAYCLDCHKGGGITRDLKTDLYQRDYVPRSHRSDFLNIHPIRAKSSPRSCNRCHDQRYCNECHARFRGEDLQILSHRRQFRDIRPSASGSATHASRTPAECPTCHPNGLLSSHKWSSDHAIEARRSLQTCQSCHSDGEVCMTCHSAKTGLKISPHPRNWNAIKGNLKSRSNGRSCTKCHNEF